MKQLQKLTNDCYNAATEEVSEHIANFIKGDVTPLQLVALLNNNALNISLASAMLAKSKPLLTAFLSAIVVNEVQRDQPEVSSIDSVQENSR
jgi:cysteine sulfinate desulfinase/cysteine desulfurase-like protein